MMLSSVSPCSVRVPADKVADMADDDAPYECCGGSSSNRSVEITGSKERPKNRVAVEQQERVRGAKTLRIPRLILDPRLIPGAIFSTPGNRFEISGFYSRGVVIEIDPG